MYLRIKELCENNKISGKELGQMLGLKKSPLTDWKNGKANPTIEQVKKMCEIFATSSEYIIFGKEGETLNEEERRVIQAYRKADPAIKTATKKLLDIQDEIPLEKSFTSKTG